MQLKIPLNVQIPGQEYAIVHVYADQKEFELTFVVVCNIPYVSDDLWITTRLKGDTFCKLVSDINAFLHGADGKGSVEWIDHEYVSITALQSQRIRIKHLGLINDFFERVLRKVLKEIKRHQPVH
ncbi:MAG TPA: hypothetical protein VJA22_03105 [Patescibacteria group bacterium]|nr:hypothetical protein [Patescibacteria group bacterium]